MFSRLLSTYCRLRPVIAHARCDVPCGIYDPASAQYAALWVVRFLRQIDELEAPLDIAGQSRLARLTREKETHAEDVKHEIRVIWGDYFNPNHFDDYPDLHSLSHSIMRKASACKQEIAVSNGEELVELLNQFAEIFWQSKGIATKRVTVPYKPGLEVVQADI